MWNRRDFREVCDPPLIGMVHLAPLPGSPGWSGDLAEVEMGARRDLDGLVEGGLRAVMVENFHDTPFYPDRVPAETTAAMAVVIASLVRRHPDVAFGVNVLRNDARAALGIAAATGAHFVRVNVHVGAAVTDQGLIQGQAHLTLRQRRHLGLHRVGILADIRVKHATPIAERPLAEEAVDLRGRGGADAIIVSGAATGAAADSRQLACLRGVLDDAPLLVGSGVSTANASTFASLADGAVVGTSLKENGAISAERTARLLAAWRQAARTGGDS